MKGTLLKVLRAKEWLSLVKDGEFAGSTADLHDGFVHLSAADQLARTLAKHFGDEACVIVAEIDPAALGDALRWEPAADCTLFPHLYGPLRLEAVVRATRYLRGADGLQAAEAVAP